MPVGQRNVDNRGDEVLRALATIGGRRAELDLAEYLLVAAARRDGASWADVATALGLRSRQAAEQRWLRLRGAVGAAPASPADASAQPAAADASAQPAAADASAQPAAAATRRRDPGAVRPSRDSAARGERDDVARLRRRAALAYDHLARVSAGGPMLRLARETLAIAALAPAGALHDLVRQALDDLGRVPEAALGPDLARAGRLLRYALDRSALAA